MANPVRRVCREAEVHDVIIEVGRAIELAKQMTGRIVRPQPTSGIDAANLDRHDRSIPPASVGLAADAGSFRIVGVDARTVAVASAEGFTFREGMRDGVS